MEELARMHCAQITAGTPRLDDAETDQLLDRLPGWQIYRKEGEPRLEKVFKFDNFDHALEFTNQVAQAAIREDHHPALLTEWGRVTVTWWTHKIRGLHMNDFIMAAQTDRLLEKSH